MLRAATLFAVAACAAARGMDTPFRMISEFAQLSRSFNFTGGKHVSLGRMRGSLGTATNCGKDTDTAKNLVISILPENPKAGDLVTTKFDYDLSKEITGGTASYKINLNGIPFPATVDDLCADQAGGVQPDPCPMAVGIHNDLSQSDFPSGVSGKISTTITWKDQDDAQILCVLWSVRV